MEDELQFFRKEQLTDNILPSSPPEKKSVYAWATSLIPMANSIPLRYNGKMEKKTRRKRKRFLSVYNSGHQNYCEMAVLPAVNVIVWFYRTPVRPTRH